MIKLTLVLANIDLKSHQEEGELQLEDLFGTYLTNLVILFPLDIKEFHLNMTLKPLKK